MTADTVTLDLPLLTAEQVADELQIPAKTVLNLAREKRLPSLKIGKHRRFSRAQVREAVSRAAARGEAL